MTSLAASKPVCANSGRFANGIKNSKEKGRKAARIGKREEVTFEQEVRTWAGVWISDKLPRNGDFILAYRAPNGEPVDPRILIDNKDKCTIAESDIDKLVRDAKERFIPVAALVARE